MIDFRYHLVSLISVFLALAVGIALGAGPLKESIGDTLTGQVDQLRAEKEELRAELDLAAAELAHTQDAITSLTPSVLAEVLGGRRVAVVVLDEVDPAVVTQVTDAIGQAGGSVSAVATVTEAWTDPGRAAFRQTLAATLVGYLDPVPAEDAGPDVELAEALAQALTTADPADPDALAVNAGIVWDLIAGDAGLVTVTEPVTAPADAVVVLAGPVVAVAEPAGAATTESPASPSPELDEAERAAQVQAWLELSRALQNRSAGAVVVTGEVVEADLVGRIRATEDLAGTLSTLDTVSSPQGLLAVPLALTARIAGVVGQYGRGEGATAAMPARVALPPIERVPSPPVEPEAPATEAPAGEG